MEKILNILGAAIPFDENGDLTSDGANAYNKLIMILNELHSIGAIDKSTDEVENYFDEIIKLGY